MQIMATNNWCSAEDIDAYNGDLVVAVTGVFVCNKILTENNMILLVDSFRLDPKQTRLKSCYKREMAHLSFLPQTDSLERKKLDDERERRGALTATRSKRGGNSVSLMVARNTVGLNYTKNVIS